MNNREKFIQERFLDNEEAVLRELKKVYQDALNDVNKNIRELDSLINENAANSLFADDDGMQKIFESMAQSKIYQKEYQLALKKQISAVLDNLQTEEFKTISGFLQKSYTDGYIGNMYDLAGRGMPIIAPINTESVIKAVQMDTKLSEGLYARLGEDIKNMKVKISAQVSRGISTGMTSEQIAQQISGESKIGYNNAVRISRTESHRIREQAKHESMIAAKARGADVQKQWDATFDGNTRPDHRRLDGQIRKIDEPFSNGLLYPGDPSGDAKDVINCRCTILQRASWELDEKELDELKRRAEFFEIDKEADFEEFEKKYLYASKNLTKQVISGKIKSENFKAAETIDGAREYLNSLGLDASYGYKDIDLSVANAINHELTIAYEQFGNLNDKGVLNGLFVNDFESDFEAAFQKKLKQIILKKSAVTNKNALQEMEKIAAEQYEDGFWSTGNKLHSIRHEIGHAIGIVYQDDEKLHALQSIIDDICQKCGIDKYDIEDTSDHYHAAAEFISYYALKNPDELIAESIAECINGKPREIAKKVMEILKK